MTAASTSRPTPVPAPADDPAGVPAAVEQLLKAHDSSSVLEICERILADFGIAGQLHWRAPETRDAHASGWCFDLAEDTQRQHVLTLSRDEPVAEALREKLAWLGRLADTRLRQLAESSRLYEAISRLALAERLQRALYAIAEQASAEHDMPALMRSLHTIVSSLMYAENFYIALYDPAGDSVM